MTHHQQRIVTAFVLFIAALGVGLVARMAVDTVAAWGVG